jgi:hypothetical protein
MGVAVGLLPVLPLGSAKVGLRTAAANSAEEIGVMNFFMRSPARQFLDLNGRQFLALNVTKP